METLQTCFPNTELLIYDNDNELDPQVIIQQTGAGDVGILFTTQFLNYTIGIDQGDEMFKIAASGVLVSQVVLKLQQAGGNVGIGLNALNSIGGGLNNVAIGENALASAVNEFSNVAIGVNALQNTVHSGLGAPGGLENVAVGANAMQTNTLGNANVAIGNNSLNQCDEGFGNNAIGSFSGFNYTSNEK